MITVPSSVAETPVALRPREGRNHDGVAMLARPHDPGGNLHDRASREVLLQRLAVLLNLPFVGAVDLEQAAQRRFLLVPADTISDAPADRADEFSSDSILGGVVPALFVGTKAITHPVLDDASPRPDEWSEAMAAALGDAALNGYTAFTPEDAARAGRVLLRAGPVRVKDVCAQAGLGQVVVHDEAHLDSVLAQEDPANLALCGIVLEENLADVVTYSVGAVAIGDLRISYFGDQTLTTDHHGREVYGGSDLTVVRGDLDVLAELDLSAELARAVACAAAFDRAAQLAYPKAVLTRRNYDVIAGTDAAGARRIGVLEQSWRIGGASGAELAAFEAFAEDANLEVVRCSTVERYDIVTLPVGATLYFQGEDPIVGAMTKYAMRLS